MMVQDEQQIGQEKEFGGAVTDGDAQQETESTAAPGDCAASGADQVGAGCVYFIRSPDGAFMKIGFTRLSVLARFSQICNGLPGLELTGYLPGSRETEYWIHSKFRTIQENGEWFQCKPELLAFMAAIGLIVPEIKVNHRPVMRKRVKPVVMEVPPVKTTRFDEDEEDYQSSMAAIRHGGKDITLAELKKRYGYTQESPSTLSTEAREFFRKQGARGGKLGLKGRMEKLTPAERSAIAKNAVRIRELKRKAQQNGSSTTPAALAESSTVAETGAQRTKKGKV